MSKKLIKAITFDKMEKLVDSIKDADDSSSVATTFFEQIKVRAQGHVYNNAESYEHRMEDIIYICNLFMGLAEEEN